MIDGVLMLGFGGPTPGCCERRVSCAKVPGCEAECFVSGILGDNPARARRVAEIAEHYRALGGFSPYNELTIRQGEELRIELGRRGSALPVRCAFRHWRPWAADGLRALRADGCREIALLVMAPHQSSVSWDWYLKHAAEAVEALGAEAPRIAAVAEPWWNHSGFVRALSDRLHEAVAALPRERVAAAELIFTAHAVPQPVESTSPYRRQFAETARLAAESFGHPEHRIAFQSQPNDSGIPWSAPNIVAVIEEAQRRGARDVIVAAAGFLVDHVEVLYDLDVEAAARARELGIGFHRARSVHDHPAFIAMLAERVLAAGARAQQR
jgi:protoporphyrin/coproporphyrin ferrochelatase